MTGQAPDVTAFRSVWRRFLHDKEGRLELSFGLAEILEQWHERRRPGNHAASSRT